MWEERVRERETERETETEREREVNATNWEMPQIGKSQQIGRALRVNPII